jgi:multidrug transporter EmrE-like cation transporter
VNGVVYLLGTVLFTVAGQLLLKWRIALAGELPPELGGKLSFLFRQLVDPWILLGLFSAFMAALCWMAALTKFELSRAYPLTSVSFVLILILSSVLFRESITTFKVVGVLLILAGIVVIGVRS